MSFVDSAEERDQFNEINNAINDHALPPSKQSKAARGSGGKNY